MNRRACCLVAVAALLTACGAAPSAGDRTAKPSLISNPSPQSPFRLGWKPGDTLQVSIDQEVRAATTAAVAGANPTTIDLAMSSRAQLIVSSLKDGVATLVVTVIAWGWRQSGTYHPAGALPAPWQLQAGEDGTVRSGNLWVMAQSPPLPGIDFLSAGLPAGEWSPEGTWSGSWLRRLADGTPLQYQIQEMQLQAPPGRAALRATATTQVTRHSYTPDDQPVLIRGTISAVIQSTFNPARGRLIDTSYTTSFSALDTEPRGTIRTEGTLVTTIHLPG